MDSEQATADLPVNRIEQPTPPITTPAVNPTAELTAQEKSTFDKLREEKKQIFVFSDSFSAREAAGWRGDLDRLIGDGSSLPATADAFYDKYLELIFGKEGATQPGPDLPSLLLVDYFEKSFLYFRGDVTDEAKEKIATLQLFLLEEGLGSKYSEELHNALSGIWSYWADPARRTQAPAGEEPVGTEIRTELFKTLENLKAKDKKETGLTSENQQYIVYAEQPSFQQTAPETPLENLRFFAKLYENDMDSARGETEPTVLQRTIIRQESYRTPLETNTYSIKATPHERLFSFERNRLPRIETVEAGRASLYLTPDPAAISDERKSTVWLDELPIEVLDLYRSIVAKTRYADSYANMSDEQQKILRRGAAVFFLRDLFDPESKMRQALNTERPEVAQRIMHLTNVYRSRGVSPEQTYLVSRIKIN